MTLPSMAALAHDGDRLGVVVQPVDGVERVRGAYIGVDVKVI
jgi:hypothetical protein